MKKTIALVSMLLFSNIIFGQFGQINPNSLQVPKVNGTNSVISPTQGMVVFNTIDQSLYYRNAGGWVNLSNSVVANPTAPNVYYKITDSTNPIPGEITTGPAIHIGETQALTFNYGGVTNTNIGTGGASVGRVVVSPATFSKLRGSSSIPLWKLISTGSNIDTIEFKYYNSSDVLYYSVKFTNAFLTQITNSAPDQQGGYNTLENLSIVFQKIGWKDYTTTPNPVGTFDVTTNTFSSTY